MTETTGGNYLWLQVMAGLVSATALLGYLATLFDRLRGRRSNDEILKSLEIIKLIHEL
jgi:hypothetical protein